MFPANDSSLNKSVLKGRGDECRSAALSISVTMLGESHWCGEEDSLRILITQCKESKLSMCAIYVYVLLMLHLTALLWHYV